MLSSWTGRSFTVSGMCLLLQKLWEKDADLACLLLSKRDSLNRALQPFQTESATWFPFRWFRNTFLNG